MADIFCEKHKSFGCLACKVKELKNEIDGQLDRIEVLHTENDRLRGLITKARNSLADYLPEYVERHLLEALEPSGSSTPYQKGSTGNKPDE